MIIIYGIITRVCIYRIRPSPDHLSSSPSPSSLQHYVRCHYIYRIERTPDLCSVNITSSGNNQGESFHKGAADARNASNTITRGRRQCVSIPPVSCVEVDTSSPHNVVTYVEPANSSPKNLERLPVLVQTWRPLITLLARTNRPNRISPFRVSMYEKVSMDQL